MLLLLVVTRLLELPASDKLGEGPQEKTEPVDVKDYQNAQVDAQVTRALEVPSMVDVSEIVSKLVGNDGQDKYPGVEPGRRHTKNRNDCYSLKCGLAEATDILCEDVSYIVYVKDYSTRQSQIS
jgi:hypothetical protein